MPDGTAGSTHSPETSVSSEIEFCGIAPRLPRKISIKFHQVRRSSATTRWQRYTPPKTRGRGGGGLARSLVRSFSLFVTDWFDSRTAARYRLDLPEIRSGGIPKIQTAVELSAQCDPSNPIERRCISRGSKIERRQRGHANLEYAGRVFYAYRSTWRRINVVTKTRNNTAKSSKAPFPILSRLLLFSTRSFSRSLFIIFPPSVLVIFLSPRWKVPG